MTEEQFAILIPHYNELEDLLVAVDSCANAELSENAHLIIVDDCSEVEQVPDEATALHWESIFRRVTIIKNEQNLGVSKSLNIGLAAVVEPFFFRIDADDRVIEHRFSAQMSLLKAGYDLVFSEAFMLFSGDRVCQSNLPSIERIRRLIDKRCFFFHPTLAASTEFFKEVGGYPDRERSGQDWRFWKKNLSKAKAVIVRDPLIELALRPNSVSNSKFNSSLFESNAFRLKLCLRNFDRRSALTEARKFGVMPFILVCLFPNPYYLKLLGLELSCVLRRMLFGSSRPSS